MALTAGMRIGPYEIVQLAGAGGMGEVYRARDPRLNRDVALKTLPATAHDPEAVLRFQREAQLLASLNHPNIAAVHGIEESGGTRALVMEFVTGRSLADVIAGGRSTVSSTGAALTLSEAIDIAKQIAAALEAAHEHGIIHRDLKPANVIVRDDGTVKVLDFGLAKMLDDRGGSGPGSASDVSGSPTITSPAFTQQGVILGTAAYMSPEQARGRPADRRSDIWAFGVVFYEMVTGTRLFRGDHVTDVLAAVVKDEPDLGIVPPSVRRVLEKCLEKDPRKRLRDISGVALLLDEPQAAPVAATPAPRRSRAAVAGIAAAAAAVVAVGALLWTQRLTPRDTNEAGAVEFAIDPPPGTSLANIHSASALSPDGRRIVFSASTGNVRDVPPLLWIRELDSIDARPLAGTEGATAPTWSPDGRSIAYMAQRLLMRLDLAGGPPVKLADVPRADPNQPVAWSKDGVILFGCPCGLDSAPATGGAVTSIRAVDKQLQETAYGAPQFLPDGNRFLYLVSSTDPKVRGVYASSLADPSQRTLLLNTTAKATYVPPRRARPGYLLWVEKGTLQARPFDADRLQWSGEPVSVVDNIALAPTTPVRAAYWVSDSGMLVYSPALPAVRNLPIVWYRRDGKSLGEAGPEAPYNAIAIAPDQERVALTRYVEVPRTGVQNGNIWTLDFKRKVDARVTFGEKVDENPLWSSDGRQIVFSSNRDGSFYQIYRQDASGAGTAERLTNAPKHMDPLDWSPDGRYLVYREMNRGTGWDLMLLPLAGDRTPIPLLQTPESDSDARFSPDGRWLVYHSRLNGKSLEVFVQAFSGDGTIGLTGSRLQVSDGGAGPLWGPGGREVYYQRFTQTAPTPDIMAVTVSVSPRLQAGSPRHLFSAPIHDGLHTKAVTADGSRFLIVLQSREKPPVPRLTAVTDWHAKIRP
jgi:Tol biopolymer transport system component